MKATAIVLLLAVCAIECRKVLPINKNANVDFINMESGGARPGPAQSTASVPKPAQSKPSIGPVTPTTAQPKPVVVTTAKPVIVPIPTVPPPKEIKPAVPKPVQPASHDLEWKSLPTKVTTPGYGSVKQLVTFYDSKGQASVIRPYSYADAVKKQ